MMLYQPFISEAPESFNSIDTYLSLLEFTAMIYIQMPISAEHQWIVAFPLIGVIYELICVCF